MSGKNARSWTNPTAGVFCWSQDVCYGVCVRQQEGQPLLDVGLKRAARLGVQEAIPVFNAEVSEMIGEKTSSFCWDWQMCRAGCATMCCWRWPQS